MSAKLQLDFLVVGGGCAGSACASILARSGARVGVVEAGRFDQFRIGETIHPSITPLCSLLGLSIPGRSDWAIPSFGVVSAWGQSSVEVNPSIMNPYGRGWRVDRKKFDRQLFEKAGEAGASLFRESMVDKAHRHGGKWQFSIVTKNKSITGTSPIVIEATGRTGRSRFAAHPGRHRFDRLVGVAVFTKLRCASSSEYEHSPLVESTQSGWWYSVFLPGMRAVAMFFTDGDLLPRKRSQVRSFLQQRLQESKHTVARCTFLANREFHWRVFDARSGIRKMAITEGCVAVGDAFMSFDPLCGRGVVEAMDSGIKAAEWLKSCPSLENKGIPPWIKDLTEHFNSYLQARSFMYRREKRWPESLFWRRRQFV